MPAVLMQIQNNDTHRLSVIVKAIRPKKANEIGRATCQRRSRVLSECLATSTIAMIPQIYGIIEISPISKLVRIFERARRSCGIHMPRPYKAIT